MKKTKLIVFIMIAIFLIIIPLTINASQINPDDYKTAEPSATEVKDMYSFGGRVAGVIQVVGTMVSAGTMIIIGIKYVVASAEEKADYKDRMIPYFIGAVLLFGASNIVKILYNII